MNGMHFEVVLYTHEDLPADILKAGLCTVAIFYLFYFCSSTKPPSAAISHSDRPTYGLQATPQASLTQIPTSTKLASVATQASR